MSSITWQDRLALSKPERGSVLPQPPLEFFFGEGRVLPFDLTRERAKICNLFYERAGALASAQRGGVRIIRRPSTRLEKGPICVECVPDCTHEWCGVALSQRKHGFVVP